MAITINGSGTITGISAGGLPDGSVTAADIASSLDLSGKTVTLPSGTGGKVLQVVQATTTTAVSTNGTSYIDTGNTVTITPSSTSSKILVMVSQSVRKTTDNSVSLKLLRGSTDLWSGQNLFHSQVNNHWDIVPMTYLDSPSTTSATTYKMQFASRDNGETVSVQYSSVRSTIIAMEIAG